MIAAPRAGGLVVQVPTCPDCVGAVFGVGVDVAMLGEASALGVPLSPLHPASIVSAARATNVRLISEA